MNTLHRLLSAVLGLAIFGLLCVYLPLQVVDYAASVSAREAGLSGRALFGAMVAAILLPFAGALWHIFRPATHRWDFRLTELCVRVVLAVPLAVWNAMLCAFRLPWTASTAPWTPSPVAMVTETGGATA